jgi:hypothetical protein
VQLLERQTKKPARLWKNAPESGVSNSALPTTTNGCPFRWCSKAATGKLEPFALIVRVNDNGAKKTYLAVAKIEAQRACVVDVIAGASGDANRRARESADRAASKPCLEGK